MRRQYKRKRLLVIVQGEEVSMEYTEQMRQLRQALAAQAIPAGRMTRPANAESDDDEAESDDDSEGDDSDDNGESDDGAEADGAESVSSDASNGSKSGSGSGSGTGKKGVEFEAVATDMLRFATQARSTYCTPDFR